MKNSPLKIGLTGGIGSGKSTVAHIIEKLGFPVYFSDSQASRLMNENATIRKELQILFGQNLYDTNGTLDKNRLASLIFKDQSAIQEVNRIVHPVVIDDFKHWCFQQTSRLLFFESAILFEAKLISHFDAIITVYADTEMRITRVLTRDGTTREKVIARINNQLEDSFKCRHSNYTINNNAGMMILQQIFNIIQTLSL